MGCQFGPPRPFLAAERGDRGEKASAARRRVRGATVVHGRRGITSSSPDCVTPSPWSSRRVGAPPGGGFLLRMLELN